LIRLFAAKKNPELAFLFIYLFFLTFFHRIGEGYQNTNTAKRKQTQIANTIRSRACYARSAASISVGKKGVLRGVSGAKVNQELRALLLLLKYTTTSVAR